MLPALLYKRHMRFRNPFHALTLVLCMGAACSATAPAASGANSTAAFALLQQTSGTLTPFTSQQIDAMLPATVYFRGKTAPLQLRNAGGVNFGGDGIFLAALVDSSGYSSSIQEAYQAYLLTETPLIIGGQQLPAGAYGAGIMNGRLTVLNIGNHPVLQALATQDNAMTRPRPLQIVADGPHAIKLYLGRNWVRIEQAGR